MKDWFKARNIWGACILSLPDEAAGRVAKAIWTYTMTGEIPDLPESERAIFALVQMTLDQDDEKETDISAKRAHAGSAGGKQKVANQANATFANEDVANQANATNKNKNKNKNKESDYYIDDDNAHALAHEHDQLFNAAESAGFARTEAVRSRLLDLYSIYGLQKMLDGISSCVEHSAVNLAYLAAALKGEPKKKNPNIRAVPSQEYNQRDYSGEQQAAMERMMSDFYDEKEVNTS